jgi:uncharacterized BrkB/YihY/UPF0761 family membrane protein
MTDNKKVTKSDKQKNAFKLQVLETFAALITAAFGLVAALAWNGAIKALIATIFPADSEGLMPMFVYAVVVTIIAIIFTLLIANAIKKAKEKIPVEKD